MKKRYLEILYFFTLIILLNYNLLATGYYVKPTASGSGDGSNWANADDWDNNFWGSVSAGDTIFMDGGTISTIYNGKDIGKSGSSGNYIYIMAGKYSPDHTNHSGRVIITNSSGAGLSNSGYDFIYVKGIEIRDGSNHGTYFYGGSNYIVFDSLTIVNNTGVGFWSEESNYHDIRNSYVESKANDGSEANDNILYQKNAHHIFIHHNYLYQKNQQNAGNHIDNIQFSNYPNSVFIYNNIAIVDSGVQGHNFILGICATGSQYHDTVLVFNNYLYNGGYGSTSGYNFYSDNIYNREAEGGTGLNPLAYTINNTLVSANCGIFSTRDGGRTAFASNNIMLKLGQNGSAPPTLPQVHMALEGEPIDSFKTNLYYQAWNGGMSYSTGGGALDWTDWTGAGGDGVNDNPEMVNDLDYYDVSTNPQPFEITSTSPAIDAGTDMSYVLNQFEYLPMFDASTDILGNERDASWDIGAFEFQTGAVDSLPNAFTFTDVTNATRLTLYTSDAILLAGFDSAYAYAGGAEFTVYQFGAIQPYTYGTGYVRVFPNDYIRVRQMSSSNYSIPTNVTLTVGSRSDTYTVTTLAEPISPSGSKMIKGANGILIKDSTGKVIKTQ